MQKFKLASKKINQTLQKKRGCLLVGLVVFSFIFVIMPYLSLASTSITGSFIGAHNIYSLLVFAEDGELKQGNANVESTLGDTNDFGQDFTKDTPKKKWGLNKIIRITLLFIGTVCMIWSLYICIRLCKNINNDDDDDSSSENEIYHFLDICIVQERARAGDNDALVELGERYFEGRDVSQDSKKALSCYEQAAEQGDTSAQYLLGARYYDGDGVPEDHVKAFLYYEQAAKQGNALSQYYLAEMYQDGDGVEQDAEKAAEWLKLVLQCSDFELEALLFMVESSKKDRKPKEVQQDCRNQLTAKCNNIDR